MTGKASIRGPDGKLEVVPLTIEGDQAKARWKPAAAGLYAIDLSASGLRPDGAAGERTAFLSIEAQLAASIAPVAWLAKVAVLAGVVAIAGWWAVRWRRKRIDL